MRNRAVNVRLSEAEHKMLSEASTSVRRSLADFFRIAALDAAAVVLVQPKLALTKAKPTKRSRAA